MVIVFALTWAPYFEINSLVYYSKNGVECGVEAHVGSEELDRQGRNPCSPSGPRDTLT